MHNLMKILEEVKQGKSMRMKGKGPMKGIKKMPMEDEFMREEEEMDEEEPSMKKKMMKKVAHMMPKPLHEQEEMEEGENGMPEMEEMMDDSEESDDDDMVGPELVEKIRELLPKSKRKALILILIDKHMKKCDQDQDEESYEE